MGYDATAYPGDVLIVPVDPSIAAILARYPLPNLPTGSYGVHTYATYSKVDTDATSSRSGWTISFRTRTSSSGGSISTTLPDRRPTPTRRRSIRLFGVTYIDRQRNVVLHIYAHESPNFSRCRRVQHNPEHSFVSHAGLHRSCGEVQRCAV